MKTIECRSEAPSFYNDPSQDENPISAIDEWEYIEKIQDKEESMLSIMESFDEEELANMARALLTANIDHFLEYSDKAIRDAITAYKTAVSRGDSEVLRHG